MKKILHKFAIWLFEKTKEEVRTPEQFFFGLKVIESKFIPKDTAMLGTGEYKTMLESFVNQEIELLSKN